MSTCRWCGRDIEWARPARGPRSAVPLERAGLALVIDGQSGVVRKIMTYRHHGCDPKEVEPRLRSTG